jgi:NO-binding membrane sensor protein with MHYT domain
MFAAINSLEQHDSTLVFWAASVCLASVAAAFGGYRRALLTRGPLRLAWIAAAAMMLGCGVWATHFLAMLAYHKYLRIGFDLGLTGLAWIAALGGMGIGITVAAHSRDVQGRVVGGAIVGGAVALTHFIGVSAMRLPAFIVWDHRLAAEATGFGVFGSAAAFALAGRLDHRARRLGSAALLALAILTLHYTAMAAVTLIPNGQTIDTIPFGRLELALGIGALAGLIVLGGLGVIAMDCISAHHAYGPGLHALALGHF